MPQAKSRRKQELPDSLAAYRTCREKAIESFIQSHKVQPLWRALSAATDVFLAHAAIHPALTLVAVGGYGRRELYPYSDVDVLILLPEAASEEEAAHAIGLLQHMWDSAVPVSHAVRTIAATIAAASADHTIATALIDARYVAGDRAQYVVLKKHLKREVIGSNKRAFIEAKLAERDRRHEKWVDSRFVLEPHVKDGKGGLRDVQTLTWLARYCYGVSQAADLVRADLLTAEERAHSREAYLFFATVRALMHSIRHRAEERLTFDLQTEIAERMGYEGNTLQARAEKFMQHYFSYTRHVGMLTRVFCAQLEEENLRNPLKSLGVQDALRRDMPLYLTLDTGRLHFSSTADLSARPYEALGLFAYAQSHGLDLHPRAQLTLARSLPLVKTTLAADKEANRLFLEILLSPKSTALTLRRMNEMGVLSAVIPEFTSITGQMQYDGYHTFTVDEHTLEAVANLSSIEAGMWAEQFPLATAVVEEISDRAPLYVAMLCHDIAKGQGGGHADKGQTMTAVIGKRLGLSQAQCELAGWLVAHHLVLSEVAFKRDLDDAKTIADFTTTVQSPERLRYLLLLTVADIKAVGPAIWNGWKGSLLRDLYTRAMAAMGIGSISEKAQAAEASLLNAWRAAPHVPVVEVAVDRFRAITEITCCAAYQPDLLRILAGVMAWMGASIVSARIQLTKENALIASIGIQNISGHAFEETAALKKLPLLLAEGIAGELDFEKELPRRRLVMRGREVSIATAAFVDNQVSSECSVIEVNAKDRIGLLYDILGALHACQLTVMTAHIATYGQKAVDVFYVKDAYGHKITHPAKLQQIQTTLHAYVAS